MNENNKLEPKVSIIIPVYNGANYLKTAIDCALAQTYSNIEVIVVNDGSCDDGATDKIASSYGEKIRYIKKENGGVSSALNCGIQNMAGEYFSWLSHDDAYTPTKVADGIEALRTAQALDGQTISYTGVNYIDQQGNVVGKYDNGLFPGRCYSGTEMAYYSTTHKTLNGCGMLIPKGAFEQCGGFDETLRYSQDALMWYTLFFAGYKLVCDGKMNVMYRLHHAQTSRTRHDLFEHDAILIAKELAPHMAECSGSGGNLLYLYALRMAKYRCRDVVRWLSSYAEKKLPFTVKQRTHLAVRLFYGRFRGSIKKIYYRCCLKVK